MKKEIIDNIKTLIKETYENGMRLPVIGPLPTDDGMCLSFINGDIMIYVEYYNDGDIGLISENYKEKRMLENIDLTQEEVLREVLKYYKVQI